HFREEGAELMGWSNIQFRPYRYVIRRLVAFAHMLVDAAILQPVQALRRQQNVIDADALVFAPGSGLVIPKGILAGLGVTGAESIGETQIFDATPGGFGLGLEQRVIDPGFGIVTVPVLRDDVVIADQGHGLFVRQKPFGMAMKALQPVEL